MEHTTKDKNDHTSYPTKERMSQKYSSRDETLGGMLIKRNKYLLKMFENVGYEVELFGSAENPLIVIDRKIRLSAFVHNFVLKITDKPYNGNPVNEVKINYTNRIDTHDIQELLHDYDQEDWCDVLERSYNPKK